jgi:hypothetical protein
VDEKDLSECVDFYFEWLHFDPSPEYIAYVRQRFIECVKSPGNPLSHFYMCTWRDERQRRRILQWKHVNDNIEILN